MAVGLSFPEAAFAVPGIELSAIHCGIKSDTNIKDLVLIKIPPESSVSAVFTKNKFCAAPVLVAKNHLDAGRIEYLIINSGNANAGTGEQGMADAIKSCREISAFESRPQESVLPFSTGVIANRLPVEKISESISRLFAGLDEGNWLEAAQGIMTTDTVPKLISEQVLIGSETVTITGISKGSGMICPDMATMLSFVCTDAKIDQEILKSIQLDLMEKSFNSITVDGDTSTNDSCVLIASGRSGVEVSQNNQTFYDALDRVCRKLAQAVIRDGEGATKFIEINVVNAESNEDAKIVAYTLAHSPLVKTALFASDPNWGRFLMAIGRAPVNNLEVDRINLSLGSTSLLVKGLPDPAYTEEQGVDELAGDEISITVDLGLGSGAATIWTSDLSYEYVKINAEYRS